MKKTIVTLIALLLASTSHALVADRFKCSIEIKDLISENTSKQDKDFFIARLPVSHVTPPGTNPPSDMIFTVGRTTERMTLDTPNATFGANLNFYFKHVVRSNPDGSVEARQRTCVGLTGDYCKRGRDNHIGHCSDMQVACMESSNPFDPNVGWAPTSVVAGIPTFNEQTLAPATRNITDSDGKTVGTVNLACKFLGSYN